MNETESKLAELIWNASRVDEGSISATGADHVARYIFESGFIDSIRIETLEQAADGLYTSFNPPPKSEVKGWRRLVWNVNMMHGGDNTAYRFKNYLNDRAKAIKEKSPWKH